MLYALAERYPWKKSHPARAAYPTSAVPSNFENYRDLTNASALVINSL